ncbi:hypothetical protein ACTL6P_19220 [Endozoicomonas acroporae]|uniref:hypothetical protein n=1 Tax=Endozoicomonas acroporae TaxID=1701104 RepID=UPI0019D5B624|nr:hypothetical protein [Endozoicomonas acroporae]
MIAPDSIPEGSIRHGRDAFYVQELELHSEAICYPQTDDTGSRHQGQNGYCTVITNELLTWFSTIGSKSRGNFQTLLPLHNNLSESQIREHVKRRKISGVTKSEDGRRSRDTFASLKKTCRQYGLAFWLYLTDRLTGSGKFPGLAQKIFIGNREYTRQELSEISTKELNLLLKKENSKEVKSFVRYIRRAEKNRRHQAGYRKGVMANKQAVANEVKMLKSEKKQAGVREEVSNNGKKQA